MQRKQRGHSNGDSARLPAVRRARDEKSVRGCPRHRYLGHRLRNRAQHAREIDDDGERLGVVGAVRAPDRVENRAVERAGLEDDATRGGDSWRPNSSSRIAVEGDSERRRSDAAFVTHRSIDSLRTSSKWPLRQSSDASMRRVATVSECSAPSFDARASSVARSTHSASSKRCGYMSSVSASRIAADSVCARAGHAYDGYARLR